LAFWTLTSQPRQPVGRADVVRSTPSMLNPWSSSNEEFPGDALDDVREALRLGVVVSDGEDIDFDGPCRVGR
jgi:hypothetical protein